MKLSERLRNGMVVRHYKGQRYLVFFGGTHTETGEELIGYYAVPVSTPQIALWLRPKSMFDDLVEIQHDNHTIHRVPRFTLESDD